MGSKNRLIPLLNKHFKEIEESIAMLGQGNEEKTRQVLTNLTTLMQALEEQLKENDSINFQALARALSRANHFFYKQAHKYLCLGIFGSFFKMASTLSFIINCSVSPSS